MLNPALKGILKDHLQTLLLSDKSSTVIDELSFFLRKLRREMMASSSLMKCSSSESSIILRHIFAYFYTCITQDS